MSVCENCNKDHAEEFKKSLPSLYLLDKAFNRIQTEGDDLFSESLAKFCYKTIRENVDEFIEKRIREGESVREATIIFAANMMVAGFGVGVGVSCDTDYDKFPTVLRDEEEQEQYIADHLAALKQIEEQRANAPQIDKEAMLSVLKEAGILPQDYDGDIEVSTIQLPEGTPGVNFNVSGGDEPETGMYL